MHTLCCIGLGDMLAPDHLTHRAWPWAEQVLLLPGRPNGSSDQVGKREWQGVAMGRMGTLATKLISTEPPALIHSSASQSLMFPAARCTYRCVSQHRHCRECLENPRDRGAWWGTVLGVTESDMTERLTLLHFTCI